MPSGQGGKMIISRGKRKKCRRGGSHEKGIGSLCGSANRADGQAEGGGRTEEAIDN
jgi:hypothetical protein